MLKILKIFNIYFEQFSNQEKFLYQTLFKFKDVNFYENDRKQGKAHWRRHNLVIFPPSSPSFSFIKRRVIVLSPTKCYASYRSSRIIT